MLIIIATTHSQTTWNPPNSGDNILNPSLSKFVGTWIWVNGTDTVKVVLKKENVLFSMINIRQDVIVGYHEYKRGNVIIETNLADTNHVFNTKKTSILASNDNSNDTLTGTIQDITEKKLLNIILVLNVAQNQLVWQTNNTMGLYNGTNRKKFTLPRSIILTKQ